MNYYKNTFYAITSIYKSLSNNRNIEIFALGFFTFIVSMNFISIWYLIFYIILERYQSTFPYELIISGGVFLFNIIYFVLNDDVRYREYKDFIKNKRRINIIYVMLYIVVSITCTIGLASYVRDAKQQHEHYESLK